MKTLLTLALLFAVPVLANDTNIRFKTGEMALLPYLEMASDALGLDLNASSLESSDSFKVTVTQGGPFTREEAMTRLYATVFQQGFTLIHDEKLGVYRLMRQRDARDNAIPFLTDLAQLKDNDELITFAFRLKHYPPEAAARMLRSFAPANSRLIPEEGSRSLIITDGARAMRKYAELLARLDNPKAAAEVKASFSKAPVCPGSSPGGEAGPLPPTLLIVLFSLIAAILGFLLRGYAIRRIEGGL